VHVAAAGDLDVGAGPGLTIEGWINPADLSYLRPIVEWNDGAGGIGTHFWTGVDTGEVGNGFRSLFANLVDTSGVSHQVRSAAGLLSEGVWQHVALTYDKRSGQALIYYNGGVAAQTNLGSFTPQSSSDFYFGLRVSGPFSGIFWSGAQDEMSLYDRALSGTEIQAIYAADGSGKCRPAQPPEPPHCVPAPLGLVSWWRAEGNADDALGHNNGLLMNGATFAPGMVGQGFLLDGIDDFVLVPDSDTLDLTGEITLEMWFKPNAWIAGDCLIDKRTWTDCNYGTIVSQEWGFQLYYNDPNIFGGDHPGNQFEISAYFPLPEIGVFHHFAGTFQQVDPGHIELKTYLDGVLVRDRTFEGNLANTLNDAPVAIGSARGGAGEFFNGIIDEVSIYNRALSTSEILAIYQAGEAGKCPNTLQACIDQLVALLADAQIPRNILRPLSSSLQTALNSCERGDGNGAINQLHAFQNKVRSQLSRSDPATADALIQAAQSVIDSIEGN
jgi:hypothetical protein